MRSYHAMALAFLSLGCGGTNSQPLAQPAQTDSPWTSDETASFVQSCSKGIRRALARSGQSARDDVIEVTCVCSMEGARERFPDNESMNAEELEDVAADCGRVHLAKQIYGAWPPQLKETFLERCKGNVESASKEAVCRCTLAKLEHRFTLLDLEEGKMKTEDGVESTHQCIDELRPQQQPKTQPATAANTET